MKRESLLKMYTLLLFIAYMLGLIFMSSVYIAKANAAEPEPIIVEKEVIVYVEKEPEVVEEPVESEIVEEPQKEKVLQTLNHNFDVFKPSNITAEELKNAIGNGPRKALLPFADAIVKAEEVHGVNALYLTATMGLESGWGKYRTGTNNIAGWKSESTGWRNFSSEEECIMIVAENLVSAYKPLVGNSISGVTRRYCPEQGYTDKVLRIMRDLQKGLV